MFRKLSISSFRFFRAGKGLSFRTTGKYLGEAMLVGVVTGFVVVLFRWAIDTGFATAARILALVESSGGGWLASRLTLAALPAIGAVLGYLLIRRFSKLEHARGTDSAIYAYHKRDGYITSEVIPVKSVASVLTVCSGGSAGFEGPVTLIGASCGSLVSRILKCPARARRILMAAGLAAGIGALFQAPMAGAIFGFEIFYSSSDVEYETMVPSFVASAVSYTIYAYFYGWQPLFVMPTDCLYDSGLRLLPYLALAILVVLGVRFYIMFFRATEEWFALLRLPRALKVAIGGMATGAIGFFVPDILGTSYSVVQTGLSAGRLGYFGGSWQFAAIGFLCFFVMKVVATSFTVGSGGSGGVFAPALVCGGALGAAAGIFFQGVLPETFGIRPAAFALVGMAGFLASAVRIPMTAIVIVAELSGNHGLLLPAMWVCGISFWLNDGWSLYRSQPHNRFSSPLHYT
ncbi:MAG: chloride channel protein [Kiritimatiellae bacterium]|jgi:CIC family chloride channel protein|nr:chloride channel protein [Kiritimatiellia bacterium]